MNRQQAKEGINACVAKELPKIKVVVKTPYVEYAVAYMCFELLTRESFALSTEASAPIGGIVSTLVTINTIMALDPMIGQRARVTDTIGAFTHRVCKFDVFGGHNDPLSIINSILRVNENMSVSFNPKFPSIHFPYGLICHTQGPHLPPIIGTITERGVNVITERGGAMVMNSGRGGGDDVDSGAAWPRIGVSGTVGEDDGGCGREG